MAKKARYDSVAEMLRGMGELQLARELEKRQKDRAMISRLVIERVRLGMKQKDVAKKSGLSTSTVCRMEQRIDNQIELDQFRRYARAVGFEFHVSFMPKDPKAYSKLPWITLPNIPKDVSFAS